MRSILRVYKPPDSITLRDHSVIHHRLWMYPDHQAVFSVRDCGIGIPEEDLDRVFDKFYRVHRKETITGTGLGLSICRGIVEAHSGRIWAMNNPNRGATITFVLPLDPAAAEQGGRT